MKKSFMFLILMLCISLLFAQDTKKKTDAPAKKEKAVEAKTAEPTPSPESLAKGKEIIKKTIEAAGGKAALEIRDIVQTMSIIANTPQGEMQISSTTTIALPNRLTQAMSTPMGDMKTVFDGTTGWVSSPNGVQELPEFQTTALKNQMAGNFYTFLQKYEQPDYVIQYLNEEKKGETSFHIVSVKHTPSNLTMKLYIDTKTFLVSKRSGERITGMGKMEVEDTFSDYRAVSGVQFPFKIISESNGNKISEATISSMKINTGVKDEVFKKPTE